VALDVAGLYRYPDPDPRWLALHSEPILEPSLPIVDGHHHLWEEPGKRYLAADLIADVSTGHNIVATVFVQCHYAYRKTGAEHLRPVGETERIESLSREIAATHPALRACSAIVGFANLLAPDLLASTLDAHLAASPARFRGVRQSVARDSHFPDGIVIRPAPAGMLSEERFVRSVRMLARRKLTFDALLYHEQIVELTRLARAAPDTTIVLNHVGCPIGVGWYRDRERETFADWQRDLRALAQCPNVHIKLGGLGMIITGARFHMEPTPPTSMQLAAAWRPYFDTCIEVFGTRRCLFESNFPVDKAMCSYAVLWNTFKRVASGASPAQKADLFEHTARRLYRLDFDTP